MLDGGLLCSDARADLATPRTPPWTKQRTNMASKNHNDARGIEAAYPLSPMQQGMLFQSLLAPGSGAYVEQLLCDLHEVVDEAALRQAWAAVIGRHAVLRTNFRWADHDEPRQEVHREAAFPWQLLDWSAIAEAEQETRLAEFLKADRGRGFDMAQAPLLRLTLLRCGEAKSRLIFTFHHALLDGRSFALILREVFAHYEAFRAGKELTLQPPRPYRDYIGWLQEQDFSKAEGFWRNLLRGFTAPTPLVVDHVSTPDAKAEIRKGDQEIRLSAEITSALRSLAEEHELTLSTIVQGAWSLLLARYSNETEVVFGVTRACRRSTIEGADAMVGVFINTLPLRVRVDPEAALGPWLKELRAQSIALRAHEHTPLEKVQRWSDMPPGTALFESILVFENSDLNSLLRSQGGAWTNRNFRLFEQTNYPLILAAYAGNELCLKVGFDRGRLDDAAVGRMLGHLQTLLEAIAALSLPSPASGAARGPRPLGRLRDLPLLAPAECRQLLVEWNRTEADYPTDSCVHELFEAQAERTPDAVAVEFEGEHLTYRQLNNRSNRIAHYLRQLGVGPGVLVGLCMGQSLDRIIALFGVLKAGGAYVPIDPAYPAARLALMLNDANAPVVLTQSKVAETLRPPGATKVICLDSPGWASACEDVVNPKRTGASADLAYVIYTSGSTGNPKGVMIPHRAVVNVMSWMQSTFPSDERDCVLHQISFSFDPSVLEILTPLLSGGRLVLARPHGHQDPAYLVRIIVQHRVTILHLVPSTLRMLLEVPDLKACRSLRHVFCGGDVLTKDLARRFFDVLNAQLHCVYGPTEAAITSIFYSIPRHCCDEIIPIGQPVANTQAYVLDGHRRPVPIGVPGELYLGGAQIGRGYLNRPELTAERFIADPFDSTCGARLYKTGDLVRRLPNGAIAFLGRVDRQVKIRGHRIELGEIETIMRLHPAVQEGVVAAREDAPGDRRLVAYVRPHRSSPTLLRELRILLKERLPAYMVPSAFVFVDTFPVTPNGKLDVEALPPPETRSCESDDRQLLAPPRTPTEEILAGIWHEFLKLKQVSVDDNFFELGGHSLMLTQMMHRINLAFGVSLGVPELFHNPTVEKLAQVIAAQQPMNRREPRAFQLQQGKGERPVYFIYAGPNEFRLAQLMGERYPTFGIEVPWPRAWLDALANNQTSAFPSLEQLVARYLEVLRSHARPSSCLLAGHSFAGFIAFEVAHRLQEQNRKVDLVILFDTWARYPTPREVAWQQWRQNWKRDLGQPSTKRPSRSFGSRLKRSGLVTQWMLMQEAKAVYRALVPRRGPRGPSNMVDEQGTPVPWEYIERLYVKILESYRPRILNARGLLFRSEPPDEKYSRAFDDSLGWSNLFAGGLKIIPVPGDHYSAIREHNHAVVQALVQEMDESLGQR
jgi:amino acid adenylation domain-containing protein